MKKLLIYKQYIILVTALVVVLLQPLHALEHFYNEVLTSETNKKHAHNDSLGLEDDCPICHFNQQPYILNDVVVFNIYTSIPQNHTIAFIAKPYDKQLFSHFYLRGPPCFRTI